MTGLCHPAFLSFPRMEPFDFSARAGFQGRPPHNREGPGSLFLAVPRAIPVHGHVRHPMRAVFNRPAGACRGGETPCREGRARRITAGPCGGFSLLPACRGDLADCPRTGPVMTGIRPVRVMGYQGPARFNTPVSPVSTLKRVTHPRMDRIIPKRRHILMTRRLIAPQSQNIITAGAFRVCAASAVTIRPPSGGMSGGAVIPFDFASAAARPKIGRGCGARARAGCGAGVFPARSRQRRGALPSAAITSPG